MEPPASGTPPSNYVRREVVERAVEALLKWKATKSKDHKPQLLSSDEFLYLVVTLKKIPQTGRINPHKIPLPHPLFSTAGDFLSGPELCLFVDDRPDRQPTSKDAKAKIAADGIPISKVIKFSKLKSDYKPFEAKRKLCDSYELFLSDRRILPLLPKLVGKHFFKKKKIPIAMTLEHQNWKEQVNRICGSALLFIKTGSCSVVKVARASLKEDDMVENVVAAIDGVAKLVPKKWKNIRSLHLKLSESLALPIYQAVPEMNLNVSGFLNNDSGDGGLVEGKKRVRGEEEAEIPSKKQKKVSHKGRIHEVRYMDDGVDGLVGEEESGSDEGEDVMFEEEMNNDDDEIGEDENLHTGRDKVVEEELSESGEELNKEDLKPKKKASKGKAGGCVRKTKTVKEKESKPRKSTRLEKKVMTKEGLNESAVESNGEVVKKKKKGANKEKAGAGVGKTESGKKDKLRKSADLAKKNVKTKKLRS